MSIEAQGHFLTFFSQVLYVFCAYTKPRYQVSFYSTIGPLVSICIDKRYFEKIISMGHIVSEMIISKYIKQVVERAKIAHLRVILNL